MPPVLWTQRQDIGPSPRAGHVAVYGPERLFLHGGESGGTLFDDSWEWDGEHWTQVADTGPAPRSGSAMAHKSSNGQILLFGGRAGATTFDDTWRWDGTNWTQAADTGPSARAGHAMAFDATRDRIVLFGGGDVASPFGDTWEWDASDWTQIQDVGPSARTRHAMAYDPGTQRVVLFGGATTGGAGLADTWAWDGASWTQIADTGPGARACAAMVPDGSGLVLFGGISTIDPMAPVGSHTIFGDTWQWAGGQWTQVQDMGPLARWLHVLGFHPPTGRVTLFGGATAVSVTGGPDGLLRDTWEHTGTPVDQGGQPGDGTVTVVSGEIIDGSVPLQQGMSLTIGFQLDAPAPAPVSIQPILAELSDGMWQPLSQPGFNEPALVTVDTGASSGQCVVERAFGPSLDTSLTYGVALLVAGESNTSVIVEFQVA